MAVYTVSIPSTAITTYAVQASSEAEAAQLVGEWLRTMAPELESRVASLGVDMVELVPAAPWEVFEESGDWSARFPTNPAELTLGARVRLRQLVDRCTFIVEAGCEGTISHLDADLLEVTLDAVVPGAAEWDNAVQWSLRDGDDPAADLELI